MEADLSDLSDSWRDTYSANFQINQINPLPFYFFSVSSLLLVYKKINPLRLCASAFKFTCYICH